MIEIQGKYNVANVYTDNIEQATYSQVLKMVINNPHVFFIEIKDSESGNVAYTIPYCTENEPSTADVDDIAVHLVDAVKERWHTLGWRHPDLYYKICFHSAFPYGISQDLLFDIFWKVRKTIDSISSEK